MTSSALLAMRVASAAPRTPKAGAPRLPKINTQFKKVFSVMDTIRIYRPS